MDGWEIYTGTDTIDIKATLEDVEKRIGLMKPHVMFEPDREVRVWSMDEESARQFFGAGPDAKVRVVKEAPETEREKQRYDEKAKLFAITLV
jgi:hypothetical protein